jgi:signal transduction histidine kinase
MKARISSVKSYVGHYRLPLLVTAFLSLIIVQYPFFSFQAVLYDLEIQLDKRFHSPGNDIVLVIMDEESDQFLGEAFPYTFATHARFLKKVTEGEPSVVGFMISPGTEIKVETDRDFPVFANLAANYQSKGGVFVIGVTPETHNQIVSPRQAGDFFYRTLSLGGDWNFSRDEVCRLAVLNIFGEDSFYLWVANKYRAYKDLPPFRPMDIKGAAYDRESDAIVSFFKYADDPTWGVTRITTVPYHLVVTGNIPNDLFRGKLVLVGAEYASHPDNFLFTPFNKSNLYASRASIQTQIIESLVAGRTVYPVPAGWSVVLGLLLAGAFMFFVSRARPITGLAITGAILLLLFIISSVLFIFWGIWFPLAHPMLLVFIVYYIWVPFRAIEENEGRSRIEKEAILLKELDSLKKNFISLMGHDLKTPLAKIATKADFLKTAYKLPEEQVRHVDQILRTTHELGEFISGILDLAKAEEGRITLNKTSRDINSVIEGVVVSLESEAAERQITIVKELTPLFPIQIDVTLIRRVIVNLVENAIKYSGEGKTIRIVTAEEGNWVIIRVCDNGAGMSNEEIEKLFKKFYRASGASAGKGTGLGLYLAKYFVELHGGSIAAHSSVGAGTIFEVRLRNE